MGRVLRGVPARARLPSGLWGGLTVPPAPARPWGKPPVGRSADLDRILALPRRTLDPDDGRAAAKWTAWLRRPDQPARCDCVRKWGFCIRDLRPIQGAALEEAVLAGGLLGAVGVGYGKTGVDLLLPMALPGVQRAVLLIPPNLKAQLLQRDIPQWSAHFVLPNIAGGSHFTPGLPVLHVVAYSELSSARATALLTTLKPDLIVADEAHNLKRAEAARTGRFLRYLDSQDPPPKLCALSGTLTTRSLLDYAHLAAHALGEGSPLPLHHGTTEEWATAIDAETSYSFAAPAGALESLCSPGEHVREGFRRRLIETRGVVATAEGSIGTSLRIARRAVAVPEVIRRALAEVRATWQRPDGEELTEATQKAAVCRQLAAGFYYRWRWPRMEPEPLILEWLAARKAWHKELREKLAHPREHLDSPLLLANAAERWHSGFTYHDKSGGHRHGAGCWLRVETEDGIESYLDCAEPEGRPVHVPPGTHHPLTWESEHWPRWRDIRGQCQPETEAVWLDDYLVQDAVRWAQEAPGILWYAHGAFGRAVAKAGQLPLFGPGEEAAQELLGEKGDRPIVASIRAHGTGKNLQMFSRNLLTNLPADGAAYEQLLGRTHRPGQRADEVTVDLYLQTEEVREAWESATSYARYVAQSVGAAQKLLYADREGC